MAVTSESSLVAPIESVNFHVWQPCNMHCRFCFARFHDVRRTVLPDGHLPKECAIAVIDALASAGFRKINLAGGEPLLCPWIVDLIQIAKLRKMTTSIVTNGTLVDENFLATICDTLDWMALSIDSVNPRLLSILGRKTPDALLTLADAVKVCKAVSHVGIRLKVNTVVTSINCDENLSEFILSVKPRRWKIMQMLPIDGQNDRSIAGLTVTIEQFERFVVRHRWLLNHGVDIIDECNEDMLESYAMVDPAGRFFCNVGQTYKYSRPILKVGVAQALNEVQISVEKFIQRGGKYAWDE